MNEIIEQLTGEEYEIRRNTVNDDEYHYWTCNQCGTSGGHAMHEAHDAALNAYADHYRREHA